MTVTHASSFRALAPPTQTVFVQGSDVDLNVQDTAMESQAVSLVARQYEITVAVQLEGSFEHDVQGAVLANGQV